MFKDMKEIKDSHYYIVMEIIEKRGCTTIPCPDCPFSSKNSKRHIYCDDSIYRKDMLKYAKMFICYFFKDKRIKI